MHHYISQHGDLPDENVEGRATGRDEALYEPRALWQVVDVPFTNQLGVPGEEIILDGTEWMNGSRYDFVLTHMLMCPINYCVTHDAYEVLQNVSVSLSHSASPISLQRYSPAFGQTLPIAPSPTFWDRSLGQQAPYDFSPRQIPAPTVNPRTRRVMAAQPRIFDVARWQFDQPYRLVRRGVVKFGLSSLPAIGQDINDEGQMRVTMGFDEAWATGSAFRQQMRVKQGTIRTGFGTLSPPRATTDFSGFPLQAGPWTEATWDNAGSYPPESQFGPKDWQRQEAGRGGGDGSGWLQGFTVHLPNYRNQGELPVGLGLVNNIDGVPYSPLPDSGVSLATRIGVRAETVNGGTNRAWWRDGAPLALVTPTLGASACMKLQTPIRLGSKEQLRVVLRSEGKNNLLARLIQLGDTEFEQDRESAGNHKVGISLTGYAIVKD